MSKAIIQVGGKTYPYDGELPPRRDHGEDESSSFSGVIEGISGLPASHIRVGFSDETGKWNGMFVVTGSEEIPGSPSSAKVSFETRGTVSYSGSAEKPKPKRRRTAKKAK